MAYYCVGGDIPLGAPDGSGILPVDEELDEVAVRRAYEVGPRHFNTSDKHEVLCLSDDSLEVFVPDGVPRQVISDGVTVRADVPIPQDSGWYYFEIEMVGCRAIKGLVGVGFSAKDTPLSPGLGAVRDTFSYTHSDGIFYNGSEHWNQGRRFGPPFGDQDRIGCLFDTFERSIHYFKNGDLIGEAFHGVDSSLPLYPAVGMGGIGLHVRVYFAVAEFKTSLQTIHETVSAYKRALYCNPMRLPARLNKFTTQGSVSLDGLMILPSEDPSLRIEHKTGGCFVFLTDRPIPTGSRCHYYEVLIKSLPFSHKGEVEVGVSTSRGPTTYNKNMAKYENTGMISILTGSSELCTALQVSYQDGDVVGCVIDMQRGHVWWTKNGVLQGSPACILDRNLPLYPSIWTHGRSSVHVNFGQEKFIYDVKTHISTQMEITASKVILPPEIVAPIAEWVLEFSTKGSAGIVFSYDMIFWKRTLGAMRLTCRFWGRAIRRYVFHNVTILSKSLYNRFTQLLAADESIGDLVHSVELRDASALPWSHYVFLSRTMNKLSGVKQLLLAGSNQTSVVAQRKARPPSLPGSGTYALIHHTFGGIHTLTVNGLSFASFHHIRHLLKGLPRLRQFNAQVLVWPEAQTRYEAMKLDAPRLSYVSVVGSTDNLIGAGLLLAAPLSPKSLPISRPALENNARGVILACARAFTEGWKGTRVSSWQFNSRIQEWMLTVAHEERGYVHDPRAEDKLHVVCGAPSATVSAQLIDVLFIIALPTQLSDAELGDIQSMPWRDINTALAQNETLEHCYIDLKSTTGGLVKMVPGGATISIPGQWATLYHAIVQNMAELYEQGKLVVRINFDPSRRPQAPPASIWAKAKEGPTEDRKDSPPSGLNAGNEAQ